jgi:hypothetical protein
MGPFVVRVDVLRRDEEPEYGWAPPHNSRNTGGQNEARPLGPKAVWEQRLITRRITLYLFYCIVSTNANLGNKPQLNEVPSVPWCIDWKF